MGQQLISQLMVAAKRAVRRGLNQFEALGVAFTVSPLPKCDTYAISVQGTHNAIVYVSHRNGELIASAA